MSEKEALELISQKLAEADKLIAEAEQIAKDNGVEFSWDGPTYGMGGYFGKASDWESSDWEDSGCSIDVEYEWRASSQSC